MEPYRQKASVGCGIRVAVVLVALLLVACLAAFVGAVVRRSRSSQSSRDFDPGPGPYLGHGTHFEAMGTPFGGCGVPPSKAIDDKGTELPFVALNTNSMFKAGLNCGRWVEITLKENCVGAGNKQWEPCSDGDGGFVADDDTGKVIYGYTMDSCPDNNFWCRRDDFHLDISEPYLESLNYTGTIWNGRKISWDYVSGTPKGWVMKEPKFMWMTESKWLAKDGSFWAVMIIYNVADGITKVEQLQGEQWTELAMLKELGNMWIMNKPGSDSPRSFTVRITGHSGEPYGVYEVAFTCKDKCKESPGLDATAKKVTAATCSADGITCSV